MAFSVTVEQLQNLVDPKDEGALKQLGGVAGVAKALKVDVTQGLTGTDLDARKER